MALFPGASQAGDLGAADGNAPEPWALHGQTTFVGQYHPAFTSPFRGPQSLDPGSRGDETWDITLFIGFRPWAGGEFWLNPEMNQGFGLSGTVGIAGFPSAEAYKLGSRDPYYKMQRGFFRQTFNLGSESSPVAPDLNQLGGSQTNDRIVVTIGKYSVVDIFDTNRYAHDPRGDFLNWSIVDLGSFDYAADAWGYTYGATAEWYQDWWTVRAGVFDGSITPNNIALDNRFISQFQTAVELEERHRLWGQDGKLKLLGYVTRARLGRYADATALALVTGAVANIAAVRDYRSKAGVGLNLEQGLTDDLGVFARVGWSQGTVESYDFTDVSHSLSSGLSMIGQRWGRPDDSIGLAIAINNLSREGRDFLNAGGLGILAGDGRLPRAGMEHILEAYYKVAVVAHANITGDYQVIANPAYSRDRGPVSVLGLRLHAQF